MEIRDNCWKCGGLGSLPDPVRPSKPSAAQGSKASSKSASNSKAEAPQQTPAKSSSATGYISAFSAVAGIAVGLSKYSSNPDPVSKAVGAGIATFALAFVALYILYWLALLVIQLLKIAIPIAILLTVGNMLEWPWAQGATQYIFVKFDHAVEAADKKWPDSPLKFSKIPPLSSATPHEYTGLRSTS